MQQNQSSEEVLRELIEHVDQLIRRVQQNHRTETERLRSAARGVRGPRRFGMPLQGPEFEERVNILLPFGDELTRPLMRQAGRDRWSADESEYAAARRAVAELERSESFPRETDPALVRDVLQALARQPATRGALEVAGMEPSGEIPYVSISDLGPIGPPIGMPVLIQEIGVLSVPPPAPAAEGAQMVQQAVQGVQPGIEVEPTVTYYTMSEFLQEQQHGAGALGYPANRIGDRLLDTEMEEEWFEAALEAGTAVETLTWGVARVNAQRAWAMPPGFFGQGIRVAVVDTGVGPHIDLPAPVASATFVPGTTSADDDHSHGTHVAGTILARRNGIGVVGVAPQAQLMRAKVLSRTGFGEDAWIAAGIVWAANNGARIINLSLGSPDTSSVMDRAVTYARSRGVAICAAAGNSFCQPVLHPAANPLCMAIAATDQSNRRASFSNCGMELDLAAPGSQVLSTVPGNAYGLKSGTSMATPHVAGVAALVLSKRPGLSPSSLQQLLERTAIPLGPVDQFGRGLAQADRAVGVAAVPALEELVAG